MVHQNDSGQLKFDDFSFVREYVWEKQRITEEFPLESLYQSFWCDKQNFYNLDHRNVLLTVFTRFYFEMSTLDRNLEI